jgi:hypothetical protein
MSFGVEEAERLYQMARANIADFRVLYAIVMGYYAL